MSIAGTFTPPRAPSAAPGEAGTGVVGAVVRAQECFDHTAFALAAFLVFPALLFPYQGELLGLLFGAALFGLAFVLKPAGRWAAQVLQRRWGFGSANVLVAAGALLAACTVAIGVLPAYGTAASLGVLLLVASRAGQGLAWGACSSMHPAPADGAAVAGALLGALGAAGMMALIASQLVHADFVAWGWRYPFCAALAVHLVALFARVRLGGAPD